MPNCSICTNPSILLHKKSEFNYYFCKFCQTLFLFPKPTRSKLDYYYKKNFLYQVTPEQEIKIRKRATKILSTLKKLNPNGKTLLDIGSGYGLLLDEAKKFKLKTMGLEPSMQLFKYSKKFNLHVKNITFEKFLNPNNNSCFDFITLIHTIEHFKEPEKIITKALSLLNKDGILFIETPNLKSHLYNFERNNYTFLTPPEHIWIFSYSSLKAILNKTDKIKIKKLSTYSYPEHFMGIIKSIFKKQKNHSHKETPHLSNSPPDIFKRFKYLIFDRTLAKLLYRSLNFMTLGSFLELYISKNSS